MNCKPEKFTTTTIPGDKDTLKLVIYRCDSHDHTEAFVKDPAAIQVDYIGKLAWSNDYGYENCLRLAQTLRWEVEIVSRLLPLSLRKRLRKKE
jgi:hypothetical protein